MLTPCLIRLRISIAVLFSVVSTVGTCADSDRQWILVTPIALKDAAKPLIERRKQQGWKVVVVDADRYSRDKDSAKSLREELVKRYGFDGKSCVLLLGAWTGDKSTRIPAQYGTRNRMKLMRTDHGFGQPEADGSLTIAVGRLPARSVDEAKVMISKLLKFESRETRINRVHLIVAHPGGRTELEKTIAANVIKTTVDVRLKRINALWKTECIMDVPNSKFQVPSEKFGSEIQRLFEQPHVFSIYSGHSSANGFHSSTGNVFDHARFAKLRSDNPAGILVCCGCYGCQVTGFGGQGYGLSAVRSNSGPIAVIGAFGESYSAMGLLALDGLVNHSATADPRELLGECWLGIQHGITRGEIQPGEFLMHDMADGTGGKVPLKDQRLEHAEMWTLLGDPAMRIPVKR